LPGSGAAAYAPFNSLRIVFARTEGDQMSQFSHSRLLAATLLLSGCFCLATSTAASEVDAAGYYKLRCASCHGANGEGTRDKSPSLGPPLRGNPLVINAPAELLAKIIRHGRGGQQRVYDDAYPNMPAFDAGMVPDVMGLAIYLKTVLQQKPAASAAAAPVISQTKGVSQ
jgi:mono/diheme cytochrome c family protein